MSIDNYNEIGLLRASVAGDAAAFESIVVRYQGFICGVTYSATGDVEKSEELAQETFISAWKSLAQLRDLEKFRGWLAAIARNVVRNSFRSQKRDIISGAASIDAVDEGFVVADESDEDVVSTERQAIVEQALKRIPEKYRDVIVLYYRQEQSIKEVAVQLELSEGAVKQRLSRGRKMLKEQAAQMIETTISKTAPGKAFTACVMGGIGAMALKGTAAAGAVATGSAVASGTGVATGGVGSAGLTAVFGTLTAKIVTAIALAVIAVGGAIVYNNSNKKEAVFPVESVAKAVQEEIKTSKSQAIEEGLSIQEESVDGQTPEQNISQTIKAEQEAPATITVAEEAGRLVRVYVTDKETGEPIEQAIVYTTASLWASEERDVTITGENGFCTLRWDRGKGRILPVWVKKDSYVRMSYSVRSENSPGDEPVVLNYAMVRATEIGGVVQGDDGENLADVEVVIRVNDDEHMDKPGNHVHRSVKTDKNGLWVFSEVPEELETVNLKAAYPGFTETNVWVKTKEAVQQLRQGEYVLRLNSGFSISGIVTDEMGIPIKGARVQLGEYYFQRDRQHRMVTGNDGAFSFDNLPVRSTGFTYDQIEGQGRVQVRYPLEYVTVSAEGFAPLTKEVYFKEKTQSLELVVTEGKPLVGRVIDVNGEPVADAAIRADEWESANRDDLRAIDWNTKSEADGRFVWVNAPDHEIALNISRKGYMTQKTQEVVSSEDEYEFVLNENMRVTGQVIDSVTKEPITRYSYRKYQGGFITTEVTIEDKDGKIKTAFNVQSKSFSIAFKADGYKPMRSRKVMLGEQDVDLMIGMVADGGISGVVVDPNGVALEGVRVVIPNGSLHVDNMEFEDPQLDYHNKTLTDDQGRFQFNAVAGDRYSLLVLEDDGYVYVSSEEFPKDGVLVLQPYAKITGTFYKGATPVVNERVRVDYPDYAYIQGHNSLTTGDLMINYGVKTDENGVFVFDKLIHGNVRIIGKPHKEVKIQAGETKEVLLGGDGLTVSGSLIGPDGNALNKDMGRCDVTIRRVYDSLPIPEDEFPMPEDHAAMSYGELVTWFTQFGNTDEGREWVIAIQEKYGDLSPHYSCDTDNNGRFEIANIKPGRYLLTVKVRAWKELDKFPRQCDYNKIIATAAEIFVVPEFATIEEMDVPVALGQVRCNKAPLAVGLKAPDFEINKLKSEGKIRLSDYEGKSLLVNFTNPALKEFYPDKVKGLEDVCGVADLRDGVSVVNVAIEMIPWDYMREKMEPQCVLPGEYGVAVMHSSKIYADYELRELPVSVLIGADGKILWKGTPDDELLGILNVD